jgi:RecA-family ATPase
MVRVSEVDAMRRGAQAPKEWRKHTAPTTMTAAELMDKELPPVKWAVSGVLPEGVTILAGKPKMGKSWLALGLCVSVAAGG